jgi:hypothetical protein
MTTWGKVLVFVNLVIALGMAAWSFGLYTGRIDWSSKPAKGTEPPGELAKRQARLREIDNPDNGSLTIAERRQRAAAIELRTLEQRRPRDAAFFAKELADVQSNVSAQNPLKVVQFKAGAIDVNPDGVVIMVPFQDRNGQPITRSLNDLDNELKQAQTDLLASITEYQKLVDQDVKLTERLVTLRQQLFAEVDVKQARVKQEIEDLKPIYINVLVESELLRKRQKALEARIVELKGQRTAQAK